MREVWYTLEDSSSADPRDVVYGDDGLLRHKDGRKVAYREHGPRSREVDVDEERAKVKPKAKETKPAEEPKEVEPKAKDMKPADETPKRGYYATRETKAD